MRRNCLLRYLIAPLILVSLLIVTTLIVRAASVRDVVISEVAWMGTLTSSSDEWIELYNNTASTINLSGWILAADDGTPSISLSGSIPPYSHFLLERTDDTSVPGVAADVTYIGALGDDGEHLHLQDNLSNVIDELSFDSGWPAGNGETTARVPMGRIDTTTDGSDSTNWRDNYVCRTATNSAGNSRTCTWSSATVAEDFDYDVYFTDIITGSDTALEDALLGLINGVGTSIDAALYGLNRQSIVNALIAAHNGGVTVRVPILSDCKDQKRVRRNLLKRSSMDFRNQALVESLLWSTETQIQ